MEVHGDLIIICPKPYSIYLRGTIDCFQAMGFRVYLQHQLPTHLWVTPKKQGVAALNPRPPRSLPVICKQLGVLPAVLSFYMSDPLPAVGQNPA